MYKLLFLPMCVAALFMCAIGPVRAAQPASGMLTSSQLLDEVQRRAFLFFHEKCDPSTGLVNDRASNTGEDSYTVASIASTGYALASLPIAVQHHWISSADAYARALVTLRFVNGHMTTEHGWYYHFVDRKTGVRVWNCELSTIDTTLLLAGALIAGQFWPNTDVQKLANGIYDRVDWNWARTNGGLQPNKQVVSMGWKPDTGFLSSNWDSYCELMTLYLLGMGSTHFALPSTSWDAWARPKITYGGITTLTGGPIFLHQMAQGFYNFSHKADRGGWNYWTTAVNGTRINRRYCLDKMPVRKTYGPNVWGLNACDGPDGYTAYDAPGHEDGTVSPTGALASIFLTPDISIPAGITMYNMYGSRIWGRYGFADAFNVDRNWYDTDVIGIDLGMATIAIENYRTGLIWRLLASHPSTARGLAKAGFHSAP